jgi:hypothetical protein
MIETILIARNRKTGKDEILAGRDTTFPKQLAAYRKFDSAVHEEYDRVALVQTVPLKKPLKLVTKGEMESRTAKHAEQIASAAADENASETAETAAPEAEKKGKKGFLAATKDLLTGK